MSSELLLQTYRAGARTNRGISEWLEAAHEVRQECHIPMTV